ncbi:MAG TPA: glycoside hydrolase family 3 N-terminal domain-containing protein, partial [Chitinophagaceae bacterium]|nr:glycoside hydrolase family 3 N-terminal domain-containing protein [Chitinophagaceae bacterium]
MWKSSCSIFLLIIFLMNTSFTNLPGKPAPHRGPTRAAKRWADSVLRTLNHRQRIAQLLMVRAYSNRGQGHVDSVTRLVQDEGVGGLVFFQGGPVRQAVLTNYYQSRSKVPLMVGIDAEWGLGMRLDSVLEFPRQMELGAISDPRLVYETGEAIGKQCRRMGIQVDFAPVVDVNNDPANPVIGDRSYGESKERVALLGTQYMLGLQSQGIIACAKHFPGHGDTKVDSHEDLPVITRTRAELEQTELYPFRTLIAAGVDAVMVAHLSVPAIDHTPHLPTSLSRKAVTGLLQQKMHFKGLVFTDALDMKGVTRYFSNGEAAVKAFQAGNDVLTLPEDVPQAINRLLDAAKHGKISWRQINARVKKILIAKYGAGLSHFAPVDTANLVRDLNEGVAELHRILADSALTVLSNENRILPLQTASGENIAYLGVGLEGGGSFAGALGRFHPVESFYFPDTGTYAQASLIAQAIKAGNDRVIIGLHGYSRFPENNFGLTQPEIQLILQLEDEMRSVTVVFGNPYALRYFSHAPALVEAFEDDSIMHEAAASLLFGNTDPSGTLPVTTSPRFALGSGLKNLDYPRYALPSVTPSEVGMDASVLSRIDTIAREAIDQGATPSCVVLAVKDGKIFFDKAYGTLNYEDRIPVNNQTV